jgi:outer membrane usher protein
VLVARLGTLDAAASMSTSTGKTGYGGFLGYSFISRRLSASVSYTYRSRDFSNITYTPTDDKPLIFRASAGLNNKMLGSLSASYQMTDMYEDSDVQATTLSYSRSLIKSTTLLASARRTEREDEDPEYEVFLGIHAYFGRKITGSIGHTNSEDSSTTRATLQKNLPAGRGYGYRADVESTDDKRDIGANVRYQNDYGTYGLRYLSREEEDNVIISSEGGIGYIDRTFFISRKINDSFAKVTVGDVEDVRVYFSHDEVGRTNKKGEAIIPELRSFHENRISINTRDIPPDYGISSMRKYISPPSRSGSVVKFDVMKVQGITGHIYTVANGKKSPIEFAFIHVPVDDMTIEGMVGRAGEFYIENVPPGAHPAKVEYLGKECIFDIIIPRSEDLFVDLGEVLCEMEE